MISYDMAPEKKSLSLQVLLPTYNGARTIEQTLRSLLSQSLQKFSVLIHDDCSSDNTEEIVRSFHDPRFHFVQNVKNLSCQDNLESARTKLTGDIVFILCQDDVLSQTALQDTYQAFLSSDDIGAVVRPYFWFEDDIGRPVRAVRPLNAQSNQTITISSEFGAIRHFFETVGQLSGLAYRRKYFQTPFHHDIFPGHVYPFAQILTRYPVVTLKDYTVAVRVSSSQSRHLSHLYNKSPVQSWVDCLRSVFKDKALYSLRERCIRDIIAKNYLGLVQIRNFSSWKHVVREIALLVRYRPANLITLEFLFFSLLVLVTPPRVLLSLTDWFKQHVLSRTLPHISFAYRLAHK